MQPHIAPQISYSCKRIFMQILVQKFGNALSFCRIMLLKLNLAELWLSFCPSMDKRLCLTAQATKISVKGSRKVDNVVCSGFFLSAKICFRGWWMNSHSRAESCFTDCWGFKTDGCEDVHTLTCLVVGVCVSGEVCGLVRSGQHHGGESSGASALRPAGDLLLKETVPAAALPQRNHQ